MVSENCAPEPQPAAGPAESDAEPPPSLESPAVWELESVTRCTPAMSRSDVTVRATCDCVFAHPALAIAGAGIAPRMGSLVPSTPAAGVTVARSDVTQLPDGIVRDT